MSWARRRPHTSPPRCDAATTAASPARATAAPMLPVARPELAPQLRSAYQDVCAAGSSCWDAQSAATVPLVYDARYNITLWGIEKLHPFDSCKFAKIVAGLEERGAIAGAQQLVAPAGPIGLEWLQQVHSADYLHALHTSSLKVAQVTELAPLALLPHPLVSRKVLLPMRMHVAGTVLAAALAVVHGCAINLGGGMHHAHREDGSGWCSYADIMLAIRRIRAASGGAVRRVLVVDLDVHQGNGVARDKLAAGDADICIVDMYNGRSWPHDTAAKAGIGVKVELPPGTADDAYLDQLARALEAARVLMQPHLVVYNAGTDILAGDPLGRLSVSAQGVARRDEMVWAFAQQLGAPIVMLLSGGYTRASAGVIVDSLTSILQGLKESQLQQQQPSGSARGA